MLMSAIATDYNRVVCVTQTRNDEEVTDLWKWWAIIFLHLKKQTGRGNYRVHLWKKKKKVQELDLAAAGWEHRDASSVCKNKSVTGQREGEGGGDGMTQCGMTWVMMTMMSHGCKSESINFNLRSAEDACLLCSALLAPNKSISKDLR